MMEQRGPFKVIVLRCDHLKDAEANASDEVKAMWGEIDGHWNTKSRCLIGVPTEEGWRVWARPDYQSAFWRAVDLLEGNASMATFSGSWLLKDVTGLMATGTMTWSSNHNPPATMESEQRALDQLRVLGDGAPAFLKQWGEDRKRKPATTKHSPRQLE